MRLTSFKDELGAPDDTKRLLTAVGLSIAVVAVWNLIFPNQNINQNTNNQQNISTSQQQAGSSVESINNDVAIETKTTNATREIEKNEVFLENEYTKVGIDVNNARISHYEIKTYQDKNNKNINPLQEGGFIEFGWVGKHFNSSITSGKWRLSKKESNLIEISANIEKETLKITFAMVDPYVIKVTQDISGNTNTSSYSRIFRLKNENSQDKYIQSYQGAIGFFKDSITELEYSKIEKNKEINIASSAKNDWAGFSDKYFITAISNLNNNPVDYGFRYNKNKDSFQIDQLHKSSDMSSFLYIGPKNIDILNNYSKKFNIPMLDKAIDFGLFYIISKPLLILLKKLYNLCGNFGLAIILLTILVRVAMIPLVRKSFKSMAEMKKVSPLIKDIQARYADNKEQMQKAIFELYKQHKINPVAGIVPVLFQIPVFFALYKVLNISLEMRGAPFVFWLKDLSMPDNAYLLNLFGILPFDVPSFLSIGVLPILMSLTMYIQQRLTPTPMAQDKAQENIMKMLPLLFCFMSGSLPSGLILYWTCSNIFSIIQQLIINRFSEN